MDRVCGSSGSSLFMVGFGENSNNNNYNNNNYNNNISSRISSSMMMMVPPLMNTNNNNSADQEMAPNIHDHDHDHHKLVLPLPWINHNISHEHENNDPPQQNTNSDIMNGAQRGNNCFMEVRNGTSATINGEDHQNINATDTSIRAKIMAHPLFSRLLAAYINCQKVGAPPEVAARLEGVFGNNCSMVAALTGPGCNVMINGEEDSELDQFMEAYCEMLSKYEQELTKPFKEAMLFFSKIDSQLKSFAHVSPYTSDSACDNVGENGPSVEEFDVNDNIIDPQAEDKELKVQLLRKYSGYLGSLKREFLKKKKNGKLPKEARQQLLDWWSGHYKWPYPSEAQKVALAETTGLDLKQINNWFINQRKRHWKPSEDMQFVVMDASTAASGHNHHPHHYYYMDNGIYNHPFPMDCSSTLL